MRLALLVVVASMPVGAEITETFHTFDVGVNAGNLQLTGHGQLRSRLGDTALYHGRVGALAQYGFRRFNLVGGYYFQETRRPLEIEDPHRPFFGVDVPLKQEGTQVSTRGVMEQFWIPGRPRFSRYRHMVRVQHPVWHRWTMQAYLEMFADVKGVSAWRPSASLRRELTRRTRLDVGYFYDWRRKDWGGPRHVIFTTLRFQLR